ncbi:phytanoyl-CoA dioxygenase family protein [Burkholderia glumae]|uniref:phytanoyl-CoA dioxygenase family protein n=1 Tax=Burkholderia glumae TaxID=337 RepID=UPI00148EC777|nr:phytanoyl-CoA dioxygenase family protein [Burkholderia glumae]MCQ0033140.1 phytanoyl-CoA dioxygenase family protein [Burkholderia glumae]MCQ0037717.1 phytanoyl-CoA dioxygenase family protein [Burkholderia glumae]QJW78968.1 phytanoyl-CoA dioxygenase family protein [Burkholderia glumae]
MNAIAETHLEALAGTGYTILPQAVSPDDVKTLLSDMQRLNETRAHGDQADQPFLNRGHATLYNLQREHLHYTRIFTGNALVMEILRGLLNDTWYKQIPQDQPNFILRSLIGRSSGAGAMPLHIDSFVPSSGKLCIACQVAIILEDQTPARGCTVVVPGSHRSDEYANQSALANAVPLETRAGDIVVWDSRLWHGALSNTTGSSRWSLIGTFVRWWMKQNYDITGTLPEPIYAALTDDEKAVMGYCSRPPRDEMERADMKTGHAQLKASVAAYRHLEDGA